MEDVGIAIQRETSLGRTLSEIRTRDEVGEERDEGEKRQKLEEEEVITTTKQSGGIFDNLIAKLSSPRATSKPNEVEVFETAVEADRNDIASSDGGVEVHQGSGDVGAESGGVVGGGVFNNLISSFFHKSDEGGDVVKNNGSEEKEEEKKNEENESEGRHINGGSFISNLVPDDVVPAADEASILIHSVVHD